MSIINLEKEAHLEYLKTDVCVIGSGPAGGILAAALAKKNVDVLLLEAGGNLPNYACDSIAGTNSFSDVEDLRFGWSRQFGGASNLWAGRTHPLEDIDFEKRAWVSDSGWPYGADVLEPYYQQAAQILGIPEYEHFIPRSNFGEKQSGFHLTLNVDEDIEAKCFQWAKKPFFVSDYLESIENSHSSLHILLNAPVTYLQENDNASSIEAAYVKKPCGANLMVKARHFVLAAGGIETPRILLNSNEIRPKGIGNDYDTVGRYFSTHPKADMAAIILNKSVSTSDAFFMDSPLANGSFRYGIGLSSKAQEHLKTLNHYVQLSPLLEYQANKAFEAIKNTKVMDNAIIDRNQLIQGFIPGLGKMVYESIGRIAKIQPRTKKFILRGFLDQYPDKENRILLSPDKKEDGTHKVDIQWRYSDKDKHSVLKFFAHLDDKLREHNIGNIEYSGLKKCEDWPLISIHSHLMGSTRMGNDKKTSVTDGNALVHGLSNLYISGPSLFPTYGFANPFLTITALSLKLADHLLKQVE